MINNCNIYLQPADLINFLIKTDIWSSRNSFIGPDMRYINRKSNKMYFYIKTVQTLSRFLNREKD